MSDQQESGGWIDRLALVAALQRWDDEGGAPAAVHSNRACTVSGGLPSYATNSVEPHRSTLSPRPR